MGRIPVSASGLSLRLSTLGESLAVCRLDAASEIPAWAMEGFYSITRTMDELSVVCPESRVPPELECEKGWRALKLEGPFEFSLVGVLASLLGPLAEVGVAIFVVSTFDTDYVLVKEDQLGLAIAALRERGHEVS